MKVGKLKVQNRRDDFNIKSLKIASYGERNDYPDRIREVFQASTTAMGCLSIARKFIFGDGFTDPKLAEFLVNEKETANHLLRRVIDDYRPHGGFAIHVNYNGLLDPVEFQIIPFEQVRIAVDDDGVPTGKFRIYNNWNRKNPLLKYDQAKIKEFDSYNPDPKVIREQIKEAGGFDKWNGQVLYFSDDGEMVYPLSPYDAAVTDMSTEEGVSTVLHRNARHNFLPAGMLIRKKPNYATSEKNDEGDSPEEDKLDSEILNWQGDERAAKIIVVNCEFEEEEPKFVPFPIQNFDRMFDATVQFIQGNIGKIFMQPPILRGEDVGAGFGADLIKNAYDAYNSQVEGERKVIEEQLMKLFETLPVQFSDYTIKPLEYQGDEKNVDPLFLNDLSKNERREIIGFEPVDEADTTRLAVELGVGGTQAMITLITDVNLTAEQKAELLITLFSLDEETAKKLAGDAKLAE
jgi:hypothetical protein